MAAASAGAVRIATQGFCTELDGVPIIVRAGDLARVGHAVMRGNEDKFAPLRVKFELVSKGK
jgi:hypothetical protein